MYVCRKNVDASCRLGLILVSGFFASMLAFYAGLLTSFHQRHKVHTSMYIRHHHRFQ